MCKDRTSPNCCWQTWETLQKPYLREKQRWGTKDTEILMMWLSFDPDIPEVRPSFGYYRAENQ